MKRVKKAKQVFAIVLTLTMLFLVGCSGKTSDKPAAQAPSAVKEDVGNSAEEKVDNLGLSDSVIFLGNRGDVNRILQAMDVFLFPSLYEGLGIAALEAQAAGLPCIISDSVPSECRVTDLAESLDLNLPIDEWADVVLEKQNTIRKNTIDDIKKSGFDVKQNVVKLEEFYLNSVEE